MSIEPEAMVGETLIGVSSSWHEFEGRRSAELVHVWLFLNGLGNLRLHTLTGLVITSADVDQPYDMGEHGRLVVEKSGPTALMERVGERVEAVSRLDQAPLGAAVGILLHFQRGSVGIADLGDDLIVAIWSADSWERFHVLMAPAD